MPFSFNNGQSNQGASEVAVSSFDRKKDSGPDFVIITLLGIFIILLLVTAGLFAYKSSLVKDIDAKKAELKQYEGGLNGVPIDEIKSMSVKLKTIGQIVNDHPFISTVFKILELSIEDGITYNSFSVTTNEKTGTYLLSLNGVSRDYTSIYKQVEVFKKDPYPKYLSKIEVSPLKLPDDKGNIKFSISMSVSIKGVLPDSVVVEQVVSDDSQKVDTTSQTQVTNNPPVTNN